MYGAASPFYAALQKVKKSRRIRQIKPVRDPTILVLSVPEIWQYLPEIWQ
jgi:hypothetical protein